jgi:hypothetical protein
MALPDSVRRTVNKEIITNLVINSVIAAVITWLAFAGKDAVPLLGGPESGAFGIIPGTFLFSAIITLVMGRMVRSRIERGELDTVRASTLPGLLRRLPENLLLRALAIGVLAWFLLAPATLLFLHLAGPTTVAMSWLLAFFVSYFGLLTILVVPLAVVSAARAR